MDLASDGSLPLPDLNCSDVGNRSEPGGTAVDPQGWDPAGETKGPPSCTRSRPATHSLVPRREGARACGAGRRVSASDRWVCTETLSVVGLPGSQGMGRAVSLTTAGPRGSWLAVFHSWSVERYVAFDSISVAYHINR